jgi:septation ring formation regulator
MELISENLLYIIIGLVIILLLILFILYRNIVSKRSSVMLDDIRVRFNQIKSTPLAFKLNKATLIAAIDEEAKVKVGAYKEDYDKLAKTIDEISEQINRVEDEVDLKKYNAANRQMSAMNEPLSSLEQDVKQMDDYLDTILEREAKQREYANVLKDRFITIKDDIAKKINLLSTAYPAIEKKLSECEINFSNFEDWMYASEYVKAHDQLGEIAKTIDDLGEYEKVIPGLFEKIRTDLSAARKNAIDKYKEGLSRGTDLAFLGVDDLLAANEIRTNELERQVAELNLSDTERIYEDILGSYQKLKEDLIKEMDDDSRLKQQVDTINNLVKSVNDKYEYVLDNYNKEKEGSDGLFDQLVIDESYNQMLDKTVAEVNDILKQSEPASLKNEKLQSYIDELNKEDAKITESKDLIFNAKKDVEYAKDQLLKLQIILNEIRVKLAQNHLPSINEIYKLDLERGRNYIESIKKELDAETIDFEELKNTVLQAVDYIYTMYNNINNVIGMALMSENTIVFGNKYRSSFIDIDSDLTRAELLYMNGEYTQSLALAIATIERIFPNAISKEKLNV